MSEFEDLFKIDKFTTEDILEMEKKHLVPAVGHYYAEPKLFVKGEGATLFDCDGKSYIDLFAGFGGGGYDDVSIRIFNE